ncbi:beta-1,3-galactosyltransferase 1-like [Lineus longissimus]|uniref:beta-1,3-galactosyltransferase 1-like n=1 Tax=Lineus longissimus TaxID=88925 RepID=UPI00315D6BF7
MMILCLVLIGIFIVIHQVSVLYSQNKSVFTAPGAGPVFMAALRQSLASCFRVYSRYGYWGIVMMLSKSRHALMWVVTLVFSVYLLIFYVGIPNIKRSLSGFRYVSDIVERYEIIGYDNGSKLYVMNQEDICGGGKKAGTPVDLLIAVITAPKYFDRREAIRKTWGGIVKTNPRIKVLFFLGVTLAPGFDEGKLWEESTVHHDMVQLNYSDTYEELTFKSISIVHWVGKFCEHALYVLKTDDDALVNVENMMTSLTNAHLKHDDFIMCYVWKGAHVIRMRKHKYFVPYEAYRKKIYPDYCGGLYAFTANLSRGLYQTSLRTPFIAMEDVYMTGMVASQMKIPLVHNDGFVLDQSRIKKRKRKIDPCIYKNVSIYVEYSPQELMTIWDKYDPGVCR